MAAEDQVAQAESEAHTDQTDVRAAPADTSKAAKDAPEGIANGENGAVNDTQPDDSSKKATSAEKVKAQEEPEERNWKARRERDQRRDRGHYHEKGGRDRRGNHRDNGPSRQKVDYSKNVKSNFEGLPESSDPDEIRKQVEFYFSDSNLPSDKFLLSKVGGSANNAVPISTIHSFKRMRHFQPFSAVVAALKDSTTLDVVDNDTAIQRKTPLPPTMGSASFTDNISLLEDTTRPRSIYAKGFGEEGPSTQFDIEAFFAPYGPTNAIRLRRSAERHFKGSVFVEFDSPATQAAFLALDPKPKWDGRDLLIMSKEAYDKAKAAEDAAIAAAGSSSRGAGSSRRDKAPREDAARNGHRDGRSGGSRGRGGRGRGGGRHDRDDRSSRRDRSRDRRPARAAAEDDDGSSPRAPPEQPDADANTATVEADAPAESKKRQLADADADDGDAAAGEEGPSAAKKSKTEGEEG